MNDNEKLKKYAIITGANGGMAKSTIDLLLNNGYYVFALDLVNSNINENASYIKCDITSDSDLTNAYYLILKETNTIDLIIHFAGIYVLDSLIEIDNELFDKSFKINVYGVYLLNKMFVDIMNKHSKIIIVTSELAKRSTLPFTGLYGITKKTLDEYAYSLKMELQLLDIDVVVIRPGAVDTKMLDVSKNELDKFVQKSTHYKVSGKNFKNIVDKVESKNISPEKVSNLIYKIINKKHPKFAYNINHNKLLKLLDIVPQNLRFKIIKSILKDKRD